MAVSMDAENMYGEIIITDAAAAVRCELFESYVKLENVDYRSAGVFLAIPISRAEVCKAGLQRVVPM